MIVRAIALKDASQTGTTCSCTGSTAGTIVDFGGRACDVVLYAGLHLLSSTAGGIKPFVQISSSSNGGVGAAWTDLVAFTSRACRDSQWAYIGWNCASATSTDRKFWRAAWTQTCAQTNNWLLGVSVV